MITRIIPNRDGKRGGAYEGNQPAIVGITPRDDGAGRRAVPRRNRTFATMSASVRPQRPAPTMRQGGNECGRGVVGEHVMERIRPNRVHRSAQEEPDTRFSSRGRSLYLR